MRRSNRPNGLRGSHSSGMSDRESLREQLASLGGTKEIVRQGFVWFFTFLVLAAVVGIITALVRLGFQFLWQFVITGIPAIGMAIWADPWLVLALVIAALLAWSRPWEGYLDDSELLPRRGSHVQNWGSRAIDDE